MHRHLIVRRGQPRGTAILAVPGMEKLVRQKIGLKIVRAVTAEHIFDSAAVIRFMMLQPMVRCLIAESQQEVISGVMARTKELAGLRDKLLQAGDVLVCNLNRLFTLTVHVNHMRDWLSGRSNLHLAEKLAGN